MKIQKFLKTLYILKIINKIDQRAKMIGIIFHLNLDKFKDNLMRFRLGGDKFIILGMEQFKMLRMLLQTIYFPHKLARLIEIDLFQKKEFLHLILELVLKINC